MRCDRPPQAIEVGAAGLIRPDLQHHLESASRSPASFVRLVGHRFVASEGGLEPQCPAQDDDEILQRAVVLLVKQLLAGLDEAAGAMGASDVFGQKAAEPLARRRPVRARSRAAEGQLAAVVLPERRSLANAKRSGAGWVPARMVPPRLVLALRVGDTSAGRARPGVMRSERRGPGPRR